MKRKILVLIVLALAYVFAQAREISRAEKIAYQTKPAVVRILSVVQGVVAYEGENQPGEEKVVLGTLGSGFLVNPQGYILTATPAVEVVKVAGEDPQGIKDKLVLKFVARKLQEENLELTRENFDLWVKEHQPRVTEMKVRAEVFLSNSEKFNYRIKKISPLKGGGNGLVILKIERDNCPVLFLGDSSSLVKDQVVWAVGYPAVVDFWTPGSEFEKIQIQPTLTRGVISALNVDYDGLKVIRADVALTPGNSGGPVVNEAARVVGVVFFSQGFRDPFSGEPQTPSSVNFLIPVNLAKEFLSGAGIKYNVSSEFTTAYNKLLQAYWKGDYFKAKELMAQVLSYMKGQPDLEKLQAEILRQTSKVPFLSRMWKKHRILVVLGGLALLFLLWLLLKGFGSGQKSGSSDLPLKQKGSSSEEKAGGLETEAAGWVEIFVKGEKIGEEVIPTGGAIIGRDPARARIVINQPIVSKVHCKIVPQEGGVFLVVDLNSTNGTYVEGNRISQEVVPAGQPIQLGKRGDVILVLKKG